MRKKTKQAFEFLHGMHQFIVEHPQFRKKTAGRTECQIQAEIRPLIIRFLEGYFEKRGIADPIARAHRSFYWEGQEGKYGVEKASIFATRNYPDFIVTSPYLVAIEYKQSGSGSIVKHGLGQSLVHTVSGEFDFVYLLFHDQSAGKKIAGSVANELEKSILERMWLDFNIFVKIV